MREINFRVWDNLANFYWGKGEGMDFKKIAFNFYESLFKENELTFQQYTGLKDKNGKEIYEGDILKYHVKFKDSQINLAPITNSRIVKALVEFRDGCYYAGSFAFTTPTIKNTDNIEVIGNIFENKDLLK